MLALLSSSCTRCFCHNSKMWLACFVGLSYSGRQNQCFDAHDLPPHPEGWADHHLRQKQRDCPPTSQHCELLASMELKSQLVDRVWVYHFMLDLLTLSRKLSLNNALKGSKAGLCISITWLADSCWRMLCHLWAFWQGARQFDDLKFGMLFIAAWEGWSEMH